MIAAANAEWQVTVGMVKNALKLKCCDRVVLEALHKQGVRFRPMREKPVRTKEDEKERCKFGKDHADSPGSFWTQSVHAYLDHKNVPRIPFRHWASICPEEARSWHVQGPRSRTRKMPCQAEEEFEDEFRQGRPSVGGHLCQKSLSVLHCETYLDSRCCL